MLLNSVIIVLREVLEAALLMSVFLASARFLKIRNRWAIAALLAGLLGAAAYGYLLDPVSELFDGVGQEICNALLQFGTFALLAAVVFQIPRRIASQNTSAALLVSLMAFTVAVAITREGAEILVYVSGFWGISDFLSAVAIGSFIGACVGSSVGVLIYYLLLAQPLRHALPTAVVLLHLIGAGMASQATRLLIQADWITVSGPLWDTSHILSEQSLAGQLLYALVGYEASPSDVEVLAYVGSLLILATAFVAGRVSSSRESTELD
jgi:high-affinity iron transporter